MVIDKFIVQDNESIIDVMKKINDNACGIAFVCENYHLQAAVTDGDIRRYILRQGDLAQPVSTIANYHTISLIQEEADKANAVMRQHSITAIPILYADGSIKKIEFLTKNVDLRIQAKKALKVPVVIMAGGKGTRLKPYTDILPKPLIPIGDRTITEHILDRFDLYDCKECYMIVNYKKEFIKAYFYDNERKRNIRFINELKYQGTGGGLKLLEGLISQTFFMSNCDILVDAEYDKILEYHKEHKNLLTVVSAKKEVRIPYGTVQVNAEGRILCMEEKPSFPCLVNTGFYIIEPELLSMIPEKTFIHITDIIENCIRENQNIGTYIIDETSWMDMGQMDSLQAMKGKLGV